MNLLRIGLVPLVTALACSPAPAPVDAAVDVPITGAVVELGTGQLSWEDIPPSGARVELIHGPQGGYHIFGRVRFESMGDMVTVRFRVTPVAGGAPVNNPEDGIRLSPGRGLLPTSRGFESASALLVVLTEIRDPTPVVGRRFRFEALVTSADGARTVTAAREVTIVDET